LPDLTKIKNMINYKIKYTIEDIVKDMKWYILTQVLVN
jgi:hypothetical protein